MLTPTAPRGPRIAVAVVLLLVLASCGDDDDSASTAATSAAAPATSASAARTTAAASTVPPTSSASPATSASAASQAPSTTSAGRGFEYTSTEGDYTVVFPAEPTERVQPQQLPDGTTTDLVIVGVESDVLFVGTARGEFPEGTEVDVQASLQGSQDQAIANVQGTLLESRDIRLQGRPGREFSASLTVDGEAGTLLQRVYLDGLVSYQVIVTGAGELSFEDQQIAAFFDSFRFTEG